MFVDDLDKALVEMHFSKLVINNLSNNDIKFKRTKLVSYVILGLYFGFMLLLLLSFFCYSSNSYFAFCPSILMFVTLLIFIVSLFIKIYFFLDTLYAKLFYLFFILLSITVPSFFMKFTIIDSKYDLLISFLLISPLLIVSSYILYFFMSKSNFSIPSVIAASFSSIVFFALYFSIFLFDSLFISTDGLLNIIKLINHNSTKTEILLYFIILAIFVLSLYVCDIRFYTYDKLKEFFINNCSKSFFKNESYNSLVEKLQIYYLVRFLEYKKALNIETINLLLNRYKKYLFLTKLDIYKNVVILFTFLGNLTFFFNLKEFGYLELQFFNDEILEVATYLLLIVFCSTLLFLYLNLIFMFPPKKILQYILLELTANKKFNLDEFCVDASKIRYFWKPKESKKELKKCTLKNLRLNVLEKINAFLILLKKRIKCLISQIK